MVGSTDVAPIQLSLSLFVNCSGLSLSGNRIPLAQNRPALRYLGAADLAKAFDELDESLAAASALRLGLPKHVIDAWLSAWRGQNFTNETFL